MRSVFLAAVLFSASASAGCGGGIRQVAEQNRTFYAHDTATQDDIELFEQPFPPLDLAARETSLEYMGVTVLAGHVHVSRPKEWTLSKASNEPGRRYVQYISPKGYIMAVYEWPDHADAPWRDVIERYEDDAKKEKAELVEARIPMATHNAQARAYVVRRRVPAAKQPFINTSLELLARSENRIVLVQIVHQGESISPLAPELLRVLSTMRVD